MHNRQSLRLPAHDYAGPAAYFVTICTRNRERLFGKVVNGEVRLNEFGALVVSEWLRSAEIRDEIGLGDFVVMPDHLHGIVVFDPPDPVRTHGPVGAHGRAPLQPDRAPIPVRAPRSLGSFVAGFKSSATKRINRIRGTPKSPVWQRNYHERIIRNRAHWDCVRNYIARNPRRWQNW